MREPSTSKTNSSVERRGMIRSMTLPKVIDAEAAVDDGRVTRPVRRPTVTKMR